MTTARLLPFLCLATLCALPSDAQETGVPPAIRVDAPRLWISSLPMRVRLRAEEPPAAPLTAEVCLQPERGEPSCVQTALGPGALESEVQFEAPPAGRAEVVLSAGEWATSRPVRVLPGWVAVPPVLLAAAALAFGARRLAGGRNRGRRRSVE